LLPTDIDIPRTEVDIQFSSVKVDDLINSIRSNTKIVFLDAGRDNPVLFKNRPRSFNSAANSFESETRRVSYEGEFEVLLNRLHALGSYPTNRQVSDVAHAIQGEEVVGRWRQ